MISSGDFIALINRQAEAAQDPRPFAKIGVVDPAYNGTVGATGAKVTFAGESTLSVRGYLPMASYVPVPSERVLLIRVGNSWVIMGALGGSASAPVIPQAFSYPGNLVLVSGKSRVYNMTGRPLTITATQASVNTAPTGATVIVDINKNGATIFGTQANRPTIAIGTFTAAGGAPTVTAWAAGEYLTVDIDQIGSTIAGADLVVQVQAK